MKRYEPRLPRARLGLTAVAMAGITMATLVALPAKLESAVTDPQMVFAAKVALFSMITKGQATHIGEALAPIM